MDEVQSRLGCLWSHVLFVPLVSFGLASFVFWIGPFGLLVGKTQLGNLLIRQELAPNILGLIQLLLGVHCTGRPPNETGVNSDGKVGPGAQGACRIDMERSSEGEVDGSTYGCHIGESCVLECEQRISMC